MGNTCRSSRSNSSKIPTTLSIRILLHCVFVDLINRVNFTASILKPNMSHRYRLHCRINGIPKGPCYIMKFDLYTSISCAIHSICNISVIDQHLGSFIMLVQLRRYKIIRIFTVNDVSLSTNTWSTFLSSIIYVIYIYTIIWYATKIYMSIGVTRPLIHLIWPNAYTGYL